MKTIYLFSIASHPKARHINPLKITLLKPEIDFTQYDNIIITSQQATKALKQYNAEEYLDKSALCISQKSAAAFRKIGGEVLAIGDGYGDNLTGLIREYPKKKKWLYLRAAKIASDFVVQCREEGYRIDEAVVYKSECSEKLKNIQVSKEAILIFTSPSSIECFLHHNQIEPTHKVIVIGESSAKSLPTSIKPIISKEKSIEACMNLALEII